MGLDMKRLRLVLSIHGLGLELDSLSANLERGIAERLGALGRIDTGGLSPSPWHINVGSVAQW